MSNKVYHTERVGMSEKDKAARDRRILNYIRAGQGQIDVARRCGVTWRYVKDLCDQAAGVAGKGRT